MIRTQRLRLCSWRDDHRAAFARMHADAEVMADQGGPRDQDESSRKFDRYVTASVEHGISRWAVENDDGLFLGYAGVMPDLLPGHPLGPHFQIGWWFIRDAGGNGYATESGSAALEDAFRRPGLDEILSYTGADNLRSHAVMARLGLRREPLRDFVARYDGIGLWRGLVWTASRHRQADPADDQAILQQPHAGVHEPEPHLPAGARRRAQAPTSTPHPPPARQRPSPASTPSQASGPWQRMPADLAPDIG